VTRVGDIKAKTASDITFLDSNILKTVYVDNWYVCNRLPE